MLIEAGNQWLLAGLAAWGVVESNVLTARPGLYEQTTCNVRRSHYVEWIESVVGRSGVSGRWDMSCGRLGFGERTRQRLAVRFNGTGGLETRRAEGRAGWVPAPDGICSELELDGRISPPITAAMGAPDELCGIGCRVGGIIRILGSQLIH